MARKNYCTVLFEHEERVKHLIVMILWAGYLWNLQSWDKKLTQNVLWARCQGVSMWTCWLSPKRPLLSTYSVFTITVNYYCSDLFPKVWDLTKKNFYVQKNKTLKVLLNPKKSLGLPKGLLTVLLCAVHMPRKSITWDKIHYLSFCLLLLEKNTSSSGKKLGMKWVIPGEFNGRLLPGGLSENAQD